MSYRAGSGNGKWEGTMEYRTIYQGAEAEIVEKKSRFIAEVFPVDSEEEAMEHL